MLWLEPVSGAIIGGCIGLSRQRAHSRVDEKE